MKEPDFCLALGQVEENRLSWVKTVGEIVSRDMIRVVMNRWRKEGRLKILGRGRDARWQRLK